MLSYYISIPTFAPREGKATLSDKFGIMINLL
jgi:hypothetical protein